MTLYQILGILGVPSLTTVLIWLYKKIKANETKQKEENEAVKAGVQALLRSQMINDYNYWGDRGYAPIYARESFENCWKWYHNLRVNGVMDDIHEKFMELPTK